MPRRVGLITARARPAAWLAFTLLVTVTLTSLPAHALNAADPAEVEQLIREGVELRQKGKDAAALPYFQRAYELDRSPRTAAQLGLSETAMGYWLAAERHLTEALSSPRHPWVLRNREQLETTLREVRSSIGELEITGPAGAEVLVNGRSAGVLPVGPIRVAEGLVTVIVRAPGHSEFTDQIRVPGGKIERLNVNLGRGSGVTNKYAASEAGGGFAPPPKPASDVADDEPEADTRARPRRSRPAPKPAPPAAPGWVRPASWLVGGLAVGALALSGYAYYRSYVYSAAFNNIPSPLDPKQRKCSTSLPMQGGADCSQRYRESESAKRLALGAVGAGGLLLTAAIVGFVWSATPDQVEPAAPPRKTVPPRPRPVATLTEGGFTGGMLLTF